MVPRLAETHTEELVQLCNACWDPGQAYNRINLMQLVVCYKSGKWKKASHLYFVSYTSVQNFNKHIPSKMIIKSSGNLGNYILTKYTHNLSLMVRGRDKHHFYYLRYYITQAFFAVCCFIV